MPMLEYYAEVTKNTQEVNILRFPSADGQAGDRPIPRPFYRIKDENFIIREARRVVLDLKLAFATHINSTGELVNANYTYEEKKGRTPSQEAASVRHEKGELIIVSRDFSAEHKQRTATAATTTPTASTPVASNSDIKTQHDSKASKEQENTTTAASNTVPAQTLPAAQFTAAAAVLSATTASQSVSSNSAAGIHFQLSTDALIAIQPAQVTPVATDTATESTQPAKPKA